MKYLRKLIPVDFLDLQGLEAWLEDMAAQGLYYAGVGSCFAHFERREPGPARYHAEPRSNFKTAPAGEQITWAAQAGWVWAGRLGHFDLYRADSPEAEDFHTDPVTQSYTLDSLSRKMSRLSLLLGVMMAVLLAFMVWSGLDSSFGPVYHLINFSSLYLYFMVLMMTLMTIHFGWKAHCLRRLRNRLQSGIPAPHPGHWRRTGLFRQEYTLLTSLVGIAVIFTSVYTLTAGRWREEIVLADRPFPILSLAELEGDASYAPVPFYYPGYTGPDRDNYVSYEWGVFAHRYEVDQQGAIAGRERDCTLKMDWYDLTFAPLAAPLMDDLLDYHVYDFDYKYQPRRYEIDDTSAPGFDELTVVTDVEYGGQQLFARTGDRVVYLRYDGGQDLLDHLDRVAAVMAWER